MGIFTRPDSKYWWTYNELTKQKERTAILIGETIRQRRDSRPLAQQVYVERMHESGSKRHRLPPSRQRMPTFDNFSAWYDSNVIVHHRGKEREREILRRLRDEFGDDRLDEITPDRVITWRTLRRSTGTLIAHFGGPQGKPRQLPPPSARTVNREVDLLQQILAAAVPTHFLASPIEGLADLEVIPPVRRTMSVDEEQRVLAVLAVDDRAILICALDTLTRLSDVLDLKRSDDHGDHLTIRHPKNGSLHTVPISKRLRAALDVVPHGIDDWYFPRRRHANTERDRRNGYAHALKRACQRAHVPYGRATRGITFHWATRRTGATRMIRSGGDGAIAITQRIGNWKDPSVLIGIYQETMTADMRAAVETVGQDVRFVQTRGGHSRNIPVRRKNQRKHA